MMFGSAQAALYRQNSGAVQCNQIVTVEQGHQFHPDSQEKQEWILELSFGNAGPSSQANLYKSMPRSAFKSMSLLGFKKWNRLRAIGY